MDFEKALEIMKIKKDYSIKELEKRYLILIKMYKNKEANKLDKSETMDDINRAYKILGNKLKGIDDTVIEERSFSNKFGEFMHYHKFHIIFTIIIVVLAVSLTYSILTRKKNDIRMVFQGLYGNRVNVTDIVNDQIKSVNYPEVHLISLNDESKSLEDAAMMQKAFAVLYSGGVDLYVVDEKNFTDLKEKAPLVDLSDIAKKSKASDTNLRYKVKDNSRELVGIDISESDFIKKLQIQGEKFIICIIDKSEFKDKALEVVEEILKK